MDKEYPMNNDVNYYVKKLGNHIQRYVHSLYDRREYQECSLMNMLVVDFLYDHQSRDIYQKDVEAEFFINRATASKMLALMEEKKLILRKVSEEDARLKKIELQPKGVELQKRCKSIRRELEAWATRNLTQEETKQFKALCQKMLDGMEEF